MNLALDKNIGGTRLGVGDVDLAQPLDTTNPLLDGVQGFWLPLPSTTGGTQLYDLSGYGRHGDFQGNPVWQADSSIKFDGSNYITTGYTKDLPSEYTIWMDFIPVTAGSFFTKEDGSNIYKNSSFTFKKGPFTNGKTPIEFKVNVTGDEQVVLESTTGINGNREFVMGTVRAGGQVKLFVGGIKEDSKSAPSSIQQTSAPITIAARDNGDRASAITVWNAGVIDRELSEKEAKAFYRERQRGFPNLLNTRSRIFGLAGTGGAVSGTLAFTDQSETVTGQGDTISSGTLSLTDGLETVAIQGGALVSGTATITDALENVQFAGDVTVAGAVAVTDQGETVDLSGSPLVGGTLSVTEGQETLSGVAQVVVGGSLSVTEGGEIIDFTSSQVIGGTLSATDQGETVSGQGQTLIAGTATLTDGREAGVVLGDTLVTGNGQVIDAGEIISGGGTVEIAGTLSIVDGQEDVSFLSVEPPRLATLNVVLRDALQLDVTLTDTITLDITIQD